MDTHRHGDDCICDLCLRDAIQRVTDQHEARPDATDQRVLWLLAIIVFGYLLLLQWGGR